MIKLEPTERQDTVWLEWRQECTTAQAALNRAVESHDPASSTPKPVASPDVYAKLKDEHYVPVKKSPFWGKCAYCEQKIASDQYGDIEHFRPKARVTDRHTSKPLMTRHGDRPHPGYYWLAYDWQNLLFACGLCNRPHRRSDDERRIGKWDHFPLIDEEQRAEAPGGEAGEQPLLINPLVEDPAEHIDVTPEGVLFAVSGSSRGQACIELLGLNDRDLPDDRGRAYDEAYRLYKDLILARLERVPDKVRKLEAQVREIERGACTHAISRRLAIRDAKQSLLDLP